MSSSAQPFEGAPRNVPTAPDAARTPWPACSSLPAAGKFEVNGRAVTDYFKNVNWLTRAVEPLKFTGTRIAAGCMVHRQWRRRRAGSPARCAWGLSRALSIMNPDLRPGLRKNGFLTRDSRMRERKKYGQKGARKRFQFSKR